jgi:hypothetical protein
VADGICALPRHQINVIGLGYCGARFHQQIMYWQYLNLPWLNLVQRNSNANNTFKMNELESKALLKDWQENFRNLFQLLRNLQCPNFYVLAKRFTVLLTIIGDQRQLQPHDDQLPALCRLHKNIAEDARGS